MVPELKFNFRAKFKDHWYVEVGPQAVNPTATSYAGVTQFAWPQLRLRAGPGGGRGELRGGGGVKKAKKNATDVDAVGNLVISQHSRSFSAEERSFA
jgi:hypothetical protein